MAGFKEYQMLFQLNASTGSGFSATFASGASSISSLQDKINSLNKTSSDISSCINNIRIIWVYRYWF